MENDQIEKKSLRIITTRSPNCDELAKICVGFANARGGKLYIGIEDNEENPPIGQIVKDDLVNQVRKRISELTINVGIIVNKIISANGGEFIEIDVKPSQTSIAATTDGRYYIRIGDTYKPVMPDDLSRLYNDKPAFVWESKVVQKVTLSACEQSKLYQFIEDIKKSQRVSDFVKQKSTEELLH
ncbi:MAG: AlbA family DNA-binding domain-containing protein [Candidatus Saccharicenans sp.]|uniref:AlbA family DNA-binding domain-containing protein n=1 Tax=Candidatus Saccharicenans sp. TaxID=2819258 RepID=UPI00404B1B95